MISRTGRVAVVRRPSSAALEIASIAVALATTAAAALEALPRVAWIGLLVVGVALGFVALRVHFRDRHSTPVPDPRDGLKAQLAEVDSVRTWLNLRDDPEERLSLDEDRVFQWAKKTYALIQKEFPAEADTFMGEADAPLGSAHFATAYVLRREQMGRDGYLESRAGMLRRLLRT